MACAPCFDKAQLPLPHAPRPIRGRTLTLVLVDEFAFDKFADARPRRRRAMRPINAYLICAVLMGAGLYAAAWAMDRLPDWGAIALLAAYILYGVVVANVGRILTGHTPRFLRRRR